MQTTTQTIGENKGFDQMAQSLRTAINEFEHSQTMFNSIVEALRPVGDYAFSFWNLTSRFVRRHPVQTTVAVCAIGFVIAALMKPNMLMSAPTGNTRTKPRKRSR